MPYIEISSRAKIHYEDMGKGLPLVLLHGWAGSGVLWRFQRELSEEFRLIIPDLRGHGRSVPLHEPFTLEALAADLCNMFERLDLQKAVIIGWSLGSQVAMLAFPMLRKRLAGVVLVGATVRFTATAGYPHGLPAEELRGMGIRLKRCYEKTMGEFFRSMFVAGELSREQEARIDNEVLTKGRLPDPAVAVSGLDVLATADLRPELSGIDLPVLLIHGDADTICPVGSSHYMKESIPDATLVEFAGVGHAPNLSRPVEFNACVRRFIRERIYGGN
jgi:non-heme chloroperoxidase